MTVIPVFRSKALLLALVLGLCAGGRAEGPEPPGATPKELEALLRELRELRIQEDRERTAWAREQAELALLLSQRAARLADTEARRDVARAGLKEVVGRLREKTAEVQRLEDRTKRARLWLPESVEWAEAQLAERPLLGGEETRRQLAADPLDAPLLSDAAARFWNVLLRIAALGVEARVEQAQIEHDGEAREVTVLRLGATGAVYQTPDRTGCGLAVVQDGAVQWRELPAAYCEEIDQAVRMARRDVPADIVTVPFPRTAEGEGR